MRVLILYNAPLLAADSPDAASEAGVIESVDAFSLALLAAGHSVSQLALGDRLDHLLHLAQGPEQPEVVVNFCEGFAGDPGLEPHVAAVLELLKLPYTGAGAETLWSTHDKARTKFLLAGRLTRIKGHPTIIDAAARMKDAADVALDATYSAKAFGKAIELATEGATLFWLTFDSRNLGQS